jgi:hypothetical protein
VTTALGLKTLNSTMIYLYNTTYNWNIAETISLNGAPKFPCLRLQRSKTECLTLAASALSKPKTPLWNEMILLATIQISKNTIGRLARPRTQHCCHHDTKVKPEAATAVIEFLMMGGKTPETCWAVDKRQDNKLKNCCIRLVIYLNCTMMHGLTNLKFYI